ncbi:oleate hydratase [Staphylococcus aureus]
MQLDDSAWQMSFTINRQQQFKDQPENEISTWIYALYSDVNGDYIKKPITECSGNEIYARMAVSLRCIN